MQDDPSENDPTDFARRDPSREVVVPMTAQALADALVPQYPPEGFNSHQTVVVRIGGNHRGDVYPIRRVIHDHTVNPPVLVLETDPAGAAHELVELGWIPGPRRMRR